MPTRSRALYLAPDVQLAFLNGDAVFLKVTRDAYFCLPQAAPCLTLAGRRLEIAAPALGDDLAAAGLVSLEAQPQAFGQAAICRPPRRSAVLDAYGPPRLADARDAVAALWDLALHYRGRDFAHLLQVAAGGRPARPGDGEAALRVARDVQRWAPFAPVPGKCLLRSFMLLRRLQAHGLDARWVIGVRTWPFRAHCWLQHGDMVLDDYAERVAAYTPILVA